MAIARMPLGLAVLLGARCMMPFAWAGEVSFHGLGDLSGGAFSSEVSAVSADGSVVVGRSVSASGTEAFCWSHASGLVGLGYIPDGISESWARGVSADGSVVVGVGATRSGWQAVRWINGSIESLTDASTNSPLRWAQAVSADGKTIVGTNGSSEAYRLVDGNVSNLSGVPGSSSSGEAVSADGSVTAISTYPGGAARWLEGEAPDLLGHLPTPPEIAPGSRARGISADGRVIVGVSSSGTLLGGEAFRWTEEMGMAALGGFADGQLFASEATGVSADGSVVVGWATNATFASEAFIWDEPHGMRHLRELLEGDFRLHLDGWHLGDTPLISADGLTLIGSGVNPSGATEGWIAHLPEPASWLVLAAGLGAVLVCNDGRRARKLALRPCFFVRAGRDLGDDNA